MTMLAGGSPGGEKATFWAMGSELTTNSSCRPAQIVKQWGLKMQSRLSSVTRFGAECCSSGQMGTARLRRKTQTPARPCSGPTMSDSSRMSNLPQKSRSRSTLSLRRGGGGPFQRNRPTRSPHCPSVAALAHAGNGSVATAAPPQAARRRNWRRSSGALIVAACRGRSRGWGTADRAVAQDERPAQSRNAIATSSQPPWLGLRRRC